MCPSVRRFRRQFVRNMWAILLALLPCTVYRIFLSYLILAHRDSPYFIWQILFVIFRHYLVVRVGGGMTGVRQYYERAERKWRTIFVGLNKGNTFDKKAFRKIAPNSFSSHRLSLHWQTHYTFLFGNTGTVTARNINATTINVGVHTQCTASSYSSIRGVAVFYIWFGVKCHTK